MKTQWCREHIKETAANCGLSADTVSECEQAAKFCDEHPEYSDCSTMAILTLIRIRDELVRDKAILWSKNALNSETHIGKNKKKHLTVPEIKKIIQKAEMEVRGELTKKYEKKRKEKIPELTDTSKEEPVTETKPPKKKNNAGNHQPGDLVESGLPPQKSVGETWKEEEKPEPKETDADGFFNTTPAVEPVDPAKAKREQMEFHAEKLLALFPPEIQTSAVDIMREHPSYKVKDVFYFGVLALANPKKK